MQAATALHAVRIIGVDMANLAVRCAVFQAAAEEILELTEHIDVRQWEHTSIGEGDERRFVTTIPSEQREALEMLLDAVEALR
jgi:hypothetical protein